MWHDYRISGPYLNNGRLRVIVKKGKEQHTISYPKYLMEVHLNKRLPKSVVVHHKDGNPLNNELSNLEILERSTHTRKHATRYSESIEVTCKWCRKIFTLDRIGQQRRTQNKNRSKAGPFCSFSCRGKYGTSIQYGSIE